MRDKGWEKPFWMQFLVVVVYLGSLFAGAFLYGMYVAITQGPEAAENIGLSAYLAAYVGAIIGVSGLFLCTKFMQNKQVAPPPLQPE